MTKGAWFVLLMGLLILGFVISQEVDATDGPFIGDAQCGSVHGETIENFDGLNSSDLCAVGGPQGHAPKQTDTGWQWICYDTNGYDQGLRCNATQKQIEVPKEETTEEETVVEEVQEIAPKPEENVVVREIPQPVVSQPIIEAPKKKSSGSSKSRNKHEVFEHECQIDRDDATWDYSRRSRSEIKERCRAEVAACPIRSQR